MTGRDFLAAGVTVRRTPGGLEVLGPAGRGDLLEELRFEVVTRLELVGDGPSIPRLVNLPDACDVCGDDLGNGRGGMCVLCELARDKRLRDKPREPSPPEDRPTL